MEVIQMNKTQRERTQKILSIIAAKIDEVLLAEVIYATGLRPETVKRYISEAVESLEVKKK
jgi:predicted transcriptional regulator